ncbi:MAG: protein phosphatase 2C domain-containing protein [Verrucomicrobiota bacterium]
MKIRAYGRSDRGIGREINEDSMLCALNTGVFAVADGLGGLPRGEVASRVAIERVAECLDPESSMTSTSHSVKQAALQANRAVYDEGANINAETGIGTTLTLILLSANRLYAAHVGDTSLYIQRGGQLSKLSKDHTMAQDVRDRLGPEEEAYIPDYFAHTLTRCLGQQPTVEVDTFEHSVIGEDRIFLCSDGVQKVFGDGELSRMIHSATDPQQFVDLIIEEGNERGAPDNITAVAVFIEAQPGEDSSA